jgi:hypothetical protein
MNMRREDKIVATLGLSSSLYAIRKLFDAGSDVSGSISA